MRFRQPRSARPEQSTLAPAGACSRWWWSALLVARQRRAGVDLLAHVPVRARLPDHCSSRPTRRWCCCSCSAAAGSSRCACAKAARTWRAWPADARRRLERAATSAGSSGASPTWCRRWPSPAATQPGAPAAWVLPKRRCDQRLRRRLGMPTTRWSPSRAARSNA